MGERNGVLTAGHREFLRGESDIDPDSDHGRKVRSRLRDRIRTVFADFGLVYRELPERDRTQVFGGAELESDPELREGLISMVAFLYERLAETDRTSDFGEIIEAGVWRSLESPRMVKYGGSAARDSPHPVDVNIDTKYAIDLGRVGEKINRDGWGALNESDLEAIETALNRDAKGVVVDSDFKEYLQANVDRVRAINEGQEEARQEMLDDVFDAEDET